MASTKTAVAETHEGTVTTPRMADKFHAYMRDRATVDGATGDGSEITAGQIERILEAESEDAIWGADSGSAIQCRDAVGMEIEVHDMRVVQSTRTDIESGTGYYITMNVTVLGGDQAMLTRLGVAPGDTIALQTGAPLIVAKIRAFEARNLLPVKGIIAGTETSSGFTVLRFKRPPARVHAA